MKTIVIRMESQEEAEILQEMVSKQDDITKLAEITQEDKVVCISVEGTSKEEDMCRMLTLNVVTDFVVAHYENRLLGRVIESNYCYFSKPEKDEIRRLSLKMVKNEDKNFLNSLFQIRRRNVIIRRLLDAIDYENEFVLAGFVNFRLKDYIKDLEEIVDKAVDDFLMEKEYKEFIRLLRYFVDIQDPQYDIVYVKQKANGSYEILDDKGNDVYSETVADFTKELSDGNINFDDFVVSSLITLAPRKIVLRGSFKNKELIHTIKSVFDKKVIVEEG